jgi:hypothetical protein
LFRRNRSPLPTHRALLGCRYQLGSPRPSDPDEGSTRDHDRLGGLSRPIHVSPESMATPIMGVASTDLTGGPRGDPPRGGGTPE